MQVVATVDGAGDLFDFKSDVGKAVRGNVLEAVERQLEPGAPSIFEILFGRRRW